MVIISSNIQTQLQTLVEQYVDYRTKGEYGISAFWFWYYQVVNYLKCMDSGNLRSGFNRIYRMPRWGKVIYTKIVIGKDIIIYADEFIYSKSNLYNWLQHKSLNNKQPYSVCDTCFGFSSVLYDNRQKYGILKPNGKPLIKPIFDDIINFHHSTDDYNIIHAIGFIGDRVYSINMEGNITLLHISKEQYLNKKHRYNEMKEKLNQIIENVLDKHLKSQRLNESSINKRRKMSRTELKNIINECVNIFLNESFIDVPYRGETINLSEDEMTGKIIIGDPLYLITIITDNAPKGSIGELPQGRTICSESEMDNIGFEDTYQYSRLKRGQTIEYKGDYPGVYVTRL